MLVYCCECKIEFQRPKSHAKRVERVFCTKQCYDKWQSRHKVAKVCSVCRNSFKVSASMVARFSTCSTECKRQKRTGPGNGKYNTGLADSKKRARKNEMSRLEYKKWRTAVFERDNYTCQLCNTRGGDLEAHHIEPWSKAPTLRYELSNGQTLCLTCHRTTF